MRFFIISQDKDYVTAPKIMNWYQETGVFKWGMEHYHSVGQRILLRLEEKENTVFTDFILGPIPLISDRILPVLKLFEPNLKFITCILLDRKFGKAEEYYLPLFQEISCIYGAEEGQRCVGQKELSKGDVKYRSILLNDHSHVRVQPDAFSKNIIIDRDRIGDKSIFRIAELQDRYAIVIRLDLAESILKRNAIGCSFKEIKAIREDCICQERVK